MYYQLIVGFTSCFDSAGEIFTAFIYNPYNFDRMHGCRNAILRPSGSDAVNMKTFIFVKRRFPNNSVVHVMYK